MGIYGAVEQMNAKKTKRRSRKSSRVKLRGVVVIDSMAQKNAAKAMDLIIYGWAWAESRKGYKFWETVYEELRRIAAEGFP